MADKLMYIPIGVVKNTPSVEYNYWLKHLDTQLNKQSKIYKSPQCC